MWFFTFYDVFNRLELTFRGGAQIKGEKYLPRFGPIWDRISRASRERATRIVSRLRAPCGDGVLNLLRQQFPSTFPLFNYTTARGRRHTRRETRAWRDAAVLPRGLFLPPLLFVLFLRSSYYEDCVSLALYSPFVMYLARRRALLS